MSFQADGSLISGQLRIAALAIAAYEIIRTVPLEYQFYKASSPPHALLLGAVRYVGIAALVSNAALYFSSFTQGPCHSVHFMPGILQLFSGLTVQFVIFYSTINISQRYKTAFAIMIFATIITVPLESISVGLNREATLFTNELTKANGCLSLVPDGVFNAGPVFYLARLGFDVSAICLSIFHLMRTGGQGNLLGRFIGNNVAFVLLDALMNLVTFLASIGLSGLQNLGSICSIVTAILIAQQMLFTTLGSESQQPQEYNHEILVLPNTPYKASNPCPFQSTGSLPRFATPQKRFPSDNSPSHTPYSGMSASAANGAGRDRSMNSMDGSASILHSCVGREALKYRVDGDVKMFQSKTSLSMPATEETRRPISLDVKRLSHLSHLSHLSQQKRLSGSKSRPTTGESSDASA